MVGFTTTCAISVYHYKPCEFESFSWGDALDTTLCDKVCQLLPAGQWFFSEYWKIWKKGKSNSDKIWTIWKKSKLNSEMIWKL
jgi:hypothetical protein